MTNETVKGAEKIEYCDNQILCIDTVTPYNGVIVTDYHCTNALTNVGIAQCQLSNHAIPSPILPNSSILPIRWGFTCVGEVEHT